MSILEKDKVSIVIPSFNRENIIGQTLESVLMQTYENWECLIVDDGSDDKTCEKVSSFASEDSRFQLLKRDRKPKGAPTCRNIGLEHAAGEYVIFLDSDDLLDTTCLEKRMKLFAQFPDNDFIVSCVEFFNEAPGDMNDQWLYFHDDDILVSFLIHGVWQTSGPTWKRSMLKGHSFMEGVASFQDWEFHMRYLLKFNPAFKIFRENIDVFIRRGLHPSITQSHEKAEVVVNRFQMYEDVFPLIIDKMGLAKPIKEILIGRMVALLGSIDRSSSDYQNFRSYMCDTLLVSGGTLFFVDFYLYCRRSIIVRSSKVLIRTIRFAFRIVLSKNVVFYY